MVDAVATRGCGATLRDFVAAVLLSTTVRCEGSRHEDSQQDARRRQPSSRPDFLIVGAGLAVGETVILLHPPSPFRRCFNSDGERASAK